MYIYIYYIHFSLSLSLSLSLSILYIYIYIYIYTSCTYIIHTIIYIYIYIHTCIQSVEFEAGLPEGRIPSQTARLTLSTDLCMKLLCHERNPILSARDAESLRPIFILRILRPRIVETKFRDHCALRN